MQDGISGVFLEVKLLVTCVLIKDKEVSVRVERAQDEAFVELTDDVEFNEITFSKHLTQLVVSD